VSSLGIWSWSFGGVLLMAAAVLEEVIFRGGLQTWLRMHDNGRVRWAGLTRANVITALVFGLAHGLLRTWALVPITLLVGLGLGALYDARQRLVPCVLLHAGLNGLWWLARPVGVGIWW